jgi:predicted O-methyltransferase YrrM
MRKNILYTYQQKYLKSLQQEVDPLLHQMEEFASVNKIPILNRESAEFLEQVVLIHRPKRVLEIGMAIGYSSIRVARNLRNKSVIDTIELSKDNVKRAKKYIAESGCGEKINIIEGDALKIMPKLTEKYDLIFLDADKEDYEKLFYNSLNLLNKRGVIFIDNLLWHGFPASKDVPPKYKRSTEHIREFNKLFVSQKGLKTTILSVGDGIGLGIKVD